MKKFSSLLFLATLLCASSLHLSAAPINTCKTNCSSSCGTCSDSCRRDCKIVKAVPCDMCDCVVNSRTHFTDHPLYFITSPERESLWRDRVNSWHDRQGAFQAVLFGGKTTERGRMATYFTPFCTSELHVKEDMTNETKAIGSNFFNVITANGNFESIIRFAPEQSVIGLGLTLKQRFAERECGRAFLFGITAPIMRVKNTMNFSEEIINDGGGVDTDANAAGVVVANMQEAFRQSVWDCGKINCACDMTKTRLAYLELILGYEVLNEECCRLESYVGVLLPTGNSVKSDFLFEPVVGYGKHTGVMFGSSADLRLWTNESEDHAWWYHFHMNGMYLMSKHEQRLLDMINKPWSRFMRMYKNKAQAQEAFDNNDPFLYTPGVNIFCQDVKVQPGFQRSYSNAFVYMRCGFTAELGYTFFGRPAECVELRCPWQPEAAFLAYDLAPGSTDKVQQINNVFDGVNASGVINPVDPLALYDENVITECDLDMQSATHPGVATHTFSGAFGYRWDDACNYPFFIGVGGSYEVSRDNSGADRWNVWAKGGVSW